MRVYGTVVEEGTNRPLAGLRVRAYDKDLVFDDKLGDAVTDAKGSFDISYSEIHFKDLNETHPDVYVRVYDSSGKKVIYTTEKSVRWSAQLEERFDIKIPKSKL
jgi:hypothetical protein